MLSEIPPPTPELEALQPAPKRRRGFAALPVEQRRRIASLGGRSAHASGHAHKFSQEEARAAGRVGGTAVAKNREHMAKIGRLGGQQRGRNQRARLEPKEDHP